MMKKALLAAVLVIVFTLLDYSGALALSPEIENGVGYLTENQNTDGSWGNENTSTNDFFASATILETLSILGNTSSQEYIGAVEWLKNQSIDTTAEISSRICALDDAGDDPDLLLSYFDIYPAAWGGHAFYGNNHLDTALALLALKKVNTGDAHINDIIGRSLNYLKAHQNDDGGWGFTADDDSDVYVSAIVLRAIAQNRNYQVQTCINDAVQFLLGHHNSDGGFGFGGTSTTYETALSLLALQESGAEILTVALQVQSFLIDTQQVNGSWNDDPYETALAMRALFLIQPNLSTSAADISFSSSMPATGQPIDISITVHNTGYNTAENIVVRIFDGDPADGGVQIGTDLSIVALAAGQSAVVSLNTSFTGSGAHNLFAQIDPHNTVDELNESDNTLSKRLWIATGADLAVLSGDLQPATYTPEPNEPFVIEYHIRNLGESAAGAFGIALYDGDPGGGGVLLQQVTLSGLSGAASRTGTLGVNLPTPGSHTLYLIADSGDQISETSETNNIASVTVVAGAETSGADLVVGSGDILIVPSRPAVGETVQIDVQVHNYGTESAGSATLELFNGDPASGGQLLDAVSIDLDPGQSYTMASAWAVPSGNHMLYAIVDRANTIIEINESNNITTAGLMTDMVDIVLSASDLKFTPAHPVAGDATALSITARNSGISSSGAFSLALYDGDPYAGGSLLQSFVIDDLSGGAEQTVVYSFIAEAHNYRFYAVADQQNQVTEFSEENNTAIRTMVILGPHETYGPDLVPLEITLSEDTLTDPNTLAINGSAIVRFQNKGDEKIDDSFTVLVYEDTDRDGQYTQGVDIELGQIQNTQALWPNGAFFVDVQLDGKVSFVGAPLSAMIDAQDMLVEQDEANNSITSGSDCEVRPMAPIQPIVEWSWQQPQMPYDIGLILNPPAIINITDDNGDGRIDENDIPDLVFNMIPDDYSKYRKFWGELRAFSGDDGSEIFKIFNPERPNNLSGGIAAGDIDNDGLPELITNTRSIDGMGTSLIAYEHDGSLKWENWEQMSEWNSANPAYPAYLAENIMPVIADLDGDGLVEIISGPSANIFNADGSVKAAKYYQEGYFASRQSNSAIDLDMDGTLEIIAGSCVFNADGTIKWRETSFEGGYTAIGNLDEDAYPEIALVILKPMPSGLSLYVFEHDGSIKWGPVSLNELEGIDNLRCEGQYPIIADFDGDGLSDIGIRNLFTYFIFDRHGQVKTSIDLKKPDTTFDRESRNAPAVFDLNGDGRAEVLIKSGGYFQIFDGKEGALLFEEPFGDLTYPYQYQSVFVADVDGDDQAEAVVLGFDRTTQEVIRVYGSANNDWVNARGIWNQQSYHASNINDDGTIPRHEAPSWLTHNTYRCQLPLGDYDNPYLTPNLTASYLRTVQGQDGITLTVRVGNGGAAVVAPNAAVDFYLGDADSGTLLGSAATTKPLAPGQYQDIAFIYDGTINDGDLVTAVVDPSDAVSECNEQDNSIQNGYSEPIGLADLKIGSEDIGLPDGTIAEGSIMSVAATVHNIGSADAANISVQLYNGHPHNGGSPLADAQTITAIGASSTEPVVFAIDTLGLAGTSMCYVVVDQANQIEEQSEDNNMAAFALQTISPDLPNLVIGAADIQLNPADAQPGQTVTISATIHNRGATTAGIPVRFYLGDPAQGGNRIFGQTIFADLVHGASTTLQTSLSTINLVGQNDIYVVVDPLNIIIESTEQDNSAHSTLFVQSAGLIAQAATDKASYSAGEDIQINWSVTDNSGTARQLTADIYILDAKGNLMALLADGQSIDVGANASVSQTHTWNTGAVLSGGYTVVLELFEGLRKVTRTTTGFGIIEDKSLQLQVACDQMVYEANQPVVISATTISQSANHIFEDLRAQVQIFAPDQSPLYSTDQTIATLMPQAMVRFTRNWNSGVHPAGQYTVELSVYDDQTKVATTQASFEIKASSSSGQGLAGSLGVTPDPVAQGEDLTLTFRIDNQGNTDINAASVRINIVDPQSQALLDVIDTSIDLPMGTVKAQEIDYNTIGLEPSLYLAILQVTTDGFDAPRTIASARFEVEPGDLLEADVVPADPVNLLVWVNDNCRRDCDKPKYFNDDNYDRRRDSDHGHGEKEQGSSTSAFCKKPERCVDIDLLKTLLDETVADYRLVFCPQDFAHELRNPYHTDILILGDHLTLERKVRDELRERVHSGTGIVSSLYLKPNGLTAGKCGRGSVQSIFGVQWRNNLPYRARQVELDTDIADNSDLLNVSGKAKHVEAIGDTVVAGWMTPSISKKDKAKHYGQEKSIAAVVIGAYGEGKTVYLAFDLGKAINEANYDAVVTLIRGAVAHVHNTDSSAAAHPYDMQAFEVRLNAIGGSLEVRIQQDLPYLFKLYDPMEELWITEFPWTRTVAIEVDQEAGLPFYLLFPDQMGEFEMITTTDLIKGDQFIPTLALATPLVMEEDSRMLLESLIADLDAISLIGKDRIIVKKALKYLENIQTRGVDSGEWVNKNLHDLLKVASYLTRVQETNMHAHRIKTDVLIRICQAIAYFNNL